MTFASSYLKAKNTEVLRNQDSTAFIGHLTRGGHSRGGQLIKVRFYNVPDTLAEKLVEEEAKKKRWNLKMYIFTVCGQTTGT